MKLMYDQKKSKDEIKAKARGINIPVVDAKLEKSIFLFGDNFIGLEYLLRNGFKDKIDLVYIDPPYNTNQIFTTSSERVRTISRQKSDKNIAYEDNLTVEDYIEFMRERLVLLHELLSEQGSIYVHIDLKMGHYIKIVLDEIFGINNFQNDICRIKSNPKNFNRKAYGNQRDMILFYSKNHSKNIFNNITSQLSDEEKQQMFSKLDESGRRYNTVPVHAPGETANGETGREWKGMHPPTGRHWRASPTELDLLDSKGLIEWSKKGNPRIKKYADEHKGKKIQDVWNYKDPAYPIYPTEKNISMLELIISQSSNQDSIVLDCFAGGATTLRAAQKLNRRWIGMDISPVSIEMFEKNFDNIDCEFIKL